VVDDGLRRYFAARRERVEPFVDRHFSLRGTLALHRAALGWDIARAPFNLVMAGPQFGLQIAGRGARRIGALRLAALLEGRTLTLRTAVEREIDWLIATELLELPFRQGDRVATRDALAETILSEPRLTEVLAPALAVIGERATAPGFRQKLEQTMGRYAATRQAAAEITTSLLSLSAGALAFNQLTPGMVTLGPVLAGMLVQQAAIASFPLGAGLGGLWYGLFPAVPSAGLIAGLTGGLMLAASTLAAFAGVVADPVQRRLGLHRKRLQRLIDSLERQSFDPASSVFTSRDHYVARLVDLFDLLGAAYRLARS
jgi:hypothetical protein